MSKKKRKKVLIVLGVLLVLLLIGIILTNEPGEKAETIQDVMKDGIMHEENKVLFFGLEVNPAVVSAYVVTAILLVCAALLRIFAIPKFKTVPGKLQLVLETAVGYFDNLAKTNSPHRNRLLGGYVFAAGAYIAVSTLFELFGLQIVTTRGISVALPAPLADINCAISLGCMSYLFILFGGLFNAGGRGLLNALKEFSLPISMSFRLFGALVSGLLVTELVYYSISLSFVLPVFVGIMFTALHAIIQTYVLTMLTSVFYGEVSEPKPKKSKKEKIKA